MSHPLGYIAPDAKSQTMSETRILYNDACPICTREIRHYDRLTQASDLPLQFEALSSSAADWGLDEETAAKRIHAKRGDEILVGVPAFLAMWAAIPRYRWLARIVGLPGVRQIAHLIYTYGFAPALFALHQRRQRRRPT